MRLLGTACRVVRRFTGRLGVGRFGAGIARGYDGGLFGGFVRCTGHDLSSTRREARFTFGRSRWEVMYCVGDEVREPPHGLRSVAWIEGRWFESG
jgi:hypothetical protein